MPKLKKKSSLMRLEGKKTTQDTPNDPDSLPAQEQVPEHVAGPSTSTKGLSSTQERRREMKTLSKAKARTDKERYAHELEREKERKKEARTDREYHDRELERQKKRMKGVRTDREYADQERQKNKDRLTSLRKDPDYTASVRQAKTVQRANRKRQLGSVSNLDSEPLSKYTAVDGKANIEEVVAQPHVSIPDSDPLQNGFEFDVEATTEEVVAEPHGSSLNLDPPQKSL